MLLNDLSEEQRFCGYIADTQARSRAVANMIGIKAAVDFFEGCGLECNTKSSLFRVKRVFQELDIADVYIGDLRIDVRLSVNNEFFIPKKHYEYGVTPDLYMFISYNSDSGETSVCGFVEPIKVDKANANNYYYFISRNTITPPERTAELFDTLQAKAKKVLPLGIKKNCFIL